jgi:hypothetical protein
MKYTLEQIIEQVLAERKYPCNPKAAARAGAEAYKRFIQPEIDRLNKQLSDYQWQLYPDRMGQ